MIDFNMERFFRDTFQKVGSVLVKEARDNMQEISYGRTYIINGKPHIASRPGDPPNNLSRDLTKSLRYSFRRNKLIFGGGYGDKVMYLKYLETSLNRPNIVKSVYDKRKEIMMIINDEAKKNIKFVD